jgi:hypothetical protein
VTLALKNRSRAASGWNDDAVMRMENAIFSSDHRWRGAPLKRQNSGSEHRRSFLRFITTYQYSRNLDVSAQQLQLASRDTVTATHSNEATDPSRARMHLASVFELSWWLPIRTGALLRRQKDGRDGYGRPPLSIDRS